MLRSLLSLMLLSLVGMTASAQYASDWNPDADGDNTIGVNDLLALLSVFEETDSDNDGIFDSQDDCVGAFDVCGVCNGPGPTVVVGDSLVCPIYGCTDNLAPNFSASANTDDGSCLYGPAQCGGQTTVTFDGHTYNLVGIGNQCWFRENLRSDNYRNGDPVLGNLTDDQWVSTTSGAQTVYGEGTSSVNQGSSDEVANLASFGRLYNWYAVNDTRGLCPAGFHVPWKTEYAHLINEFGGDGSDQGNSLVLNSLKASPPDWDGTNASGFTALPSGARNCCLGYFTHIHGYWSATAQGVNGNYLVFLPNPANYSGPLVASVSQRFGFAVRCLKD